MSLLSLIFLLSQASAGVSAVTGSCYRGIIVGYDLDGITIENKQKKFTASFKNPDHSAKSVEQKLGSWVQICKVPIRFNSRK